MKVVTFWLKIQIRGYPPYNHFAMDIRELKLALR